MPESVDITAKEFAKSTGVGKEPPEHGRVGRGILEPSQAVQKIFVEDDDSVFEKRVQAIAFLADVVWMVEYRESEERNHSLTGANFWRAARGVFSPGIRKAIGEVNRIYSRVAYDHGNRTRKYDTSKVLDPAREDRSEDDIKSKAYETIAGTVDFADQFSDEDLMRVCLTLDDVEGMETGELIDMKHVSKTI